MEIEIPAGNKLRLFWAITLPHDLCHEIRNFVTRNLVRVGDCRWSPPENLHITLHFLGGVPEAMTDEIIRHTEEALIGVNQFKIHVKGVGYFTPANPKTIYAGVQLNDTILDDVVKKIGTTMQALNLRQEKKEFSPHVTLGRVRGKCRVLELNQAVTTHAHHIFGEITAAKISLMKSETLPEGSRYSEIASIELDPT